MDVLLGVCGFVVDICEDSAIYVFYEDVKNESSLELFYSKFYFGV